MKKIFSTILLLVLVALMFSLCGCKSQKQKFSDYSFDYFDTVTTIVGYEETEDEFKQNCEKIKNELREYHKLYTIYSRYENFNNLTTVNELTEGKHNDVKVDEKIIKMLSFARDMYNKTGGQVNVALGSVLSIWHEYREEGLENPEIARLPDMADLKKAAEHTDIKDMIIDSQNNSVFLRDSAMKLDVGAIAKGYATEQVALWMKENGMENYLLNVGGNIRAVGNRGDGEKWQIGIEDPDGGEDYVELLAIENMSLVTSGSYQRFYTVDGKNYHHIIDPDTLLPAEGFKSVSVLCESSAVADALSTALFSMDLEEGIKLIESFENVHAMWINEKGEKFYSENFEKFCKQQ